MFVCSDCAETYPEDGFCGRDGAKLSSTEKDALLGSTVGAYHIAALVGVGGFGRVYKGVHPEIGSRVAIKVLTRDCVTHPEHLTRFFNEAKAVNLIRHENIVNIIDLAQLPDQRPYIVMEYLDGMSLAECIATKGVLGISETCQICAQALDALNVAHQKGIIHRDLKPDNLFITPEGRTKVLDFGIAKLWGDETDGAQTRTGLLMGTPQYMSPEQALARPVDPRSDIYSMGVILFRCLTGAPIFEAAAVLELARAHAERPPKPPSSLRPEIPPELDALVLRALAKDPAARWQDAASLAEALRKIAAKHPGKRTKGFAAADYDSRLHAQDPVKMPTVPPPTQGYSLPGESKPTPGSVTTKQRSKVWVVGALLALAALAAVAITAGRSGSVGVAETTTHDGTEAAPAATVDAAAVLTAANGNRGRVARRVGKDGFPQTGSAKAETAEDLVMEYEYEGVVYPNTQVFYKLEARAGQWVTFTYLLEKIIPLPHTGVRNTYGINLTINFLDEKGVRISGAIPAAYADNETEKMDTEIVRFAQKRSGSVFLYMSCDGCSKPIHYKFTARRSAMCGDRTCEPLTNGK